MRKQEIEQGFATLGLSDDKLRETLSRLAMLIQPKPGPQYKITTAEHTLPFDDQRKAQTAKEL